MDALPTVPVTIKDKIQLVNLLVQVIYPVIGSPPPPQTQQTIKNKITFVKTMTGLLVAHFENIGFHIGSSYSKYRLFIGFSIKNIG